MNRESNSYTVVYATIMVVLVAVALAFTAQALKETQDNNVKIDKMQQILRSVGIVENAKSAVIDKYRSTIKQELLVRADGSIAQTYEGNKIADNEAFSLNTANAFKELSKGKKDLTMPVYVAEVAGTTKYIFPLNGAGLWGPIWGYISVDEDCNTVFGSDFGHQGETPGLGAEIATPKFIDQFSGKTLFDKDEFVSIAVVKPGQKPHREGQDYVDGISGGTLTSNGVNEMLFSSLRHYTAFLMQHCATADTPALSSADGEEAVQDVSMTTVIENN